MNNKLLQRRQRLMPGDVPRHIRVYDNGGETFDRYTVVYTGRYRRNPRDGYQYVGMSEHPFHPQGFGQHGETRDRPCDYAEHSNHVPPVGKSCHLGKRITFADLPADCQRLVLRDYRELWDLSATVAATQSS